MKRILSKRQIQTVTLLSAVILILLCGVLYTLSTRTDAPASTVPVDSDVIKPPHKLERDARVSANENIDWEQNFGGTQDDLPIAVIYKNNEIYIFGNTSSSDLDFASADEGKTRGFGARLSGAGRTLEFTVFDFTVAKAIPTAAGFAVAGNEGSAAGLYLLDDKLTVTGKAIMPPAHILTACGLYVYENRYFLVAQSRNELTDAATLLLHVYTSGLTLERETVFSHTYGLTMLDILPYGDGYMLAAAATYQDLGYLTVFRFDMMSHPSNVDFSLGYAYTPTAIIPVDGGYAVSSERDGNCELLLLGDSLERKYVGFLTQTPNQNEKTLFYAGAPYVFTGESLLKLSDDGRTTVGSLEFAPKRITSFVTNAAAAFIAGVSDDGIKIVMTSPRASKTVSLAIDSPTRALLYAGEDKLLLASDSYKATADCGEVYGGGDVWVSAIPMAT